MNFCKSTKGNFKEVKGEKAIQKAEFLCFQGYRQGCMLDHPKDSLLRFYGGGQPKMSPFISAHK